MNDAGARLYGRLVKADSAALNAMAEDARRHLPEVSHGA